MSVHGTGGHDRRAAGGCRLFDTTATTSGVFRTAPLGRYDAPSGTGMRRRTFIAAVAGAAAMPLAVRAQQRTPVLGFLTTLASSDRPQLREAFRKGLDEGGYADRHNLTIEYRFADNQLDRLRAMAADLITRKVDVIAATGGNITGLIVKTLTSTIPVVFTSGADPVQAGLVASLSRPEANVTGVSWFNVDAGLKHVGLLPRALAPGRAVCRAAQ